MSRRFLFVVALGLAPCALGVLACEGSEATAAASPPPSSTGPTGSEQPPDAGSADPARFVATAPLAFARFGHTSTGLADDRVVVVGGETTSRAPLAVEVFDPAVGTWTTLASLPAPRENHTTTLLADGRLLVVGGGASNSVGGPAGKDVLATTLLVDPVAGTVTPGPALRTARSHHAATLLPDGRVLVTGGATGAHVVPDFGDATASAELFDPKANAWTEAPPLGTPRFLHTATLAGGSEVVVAGGSDEKERQLPRVERFDVPSGRWSAGPDLGTARVFHAATALADGSLLLVAGKLSNTRFLGTTELLAVGGTAWSVGPELPDTRTAPAIARLPSGRVLVTGGLHGSTSGFRTLGDAHLYDPAVRSFTPIAPMKAARVLHAATALADGRVLVCGGLDASGEGLATCELASP